MVRHLFLMTTRRIGLVFGILSLRDLYQGIETCFKIVKTSKMKNHFLIKLACNYSDRPPISHKVIEYLEQFIIDNILIPKKIIIGGKWNIWLAISFMKEGNFGPKGVYMYKPTTVSGDNVKFYPIDIPLKEIKESEKPYLRTIELLLEGVRLFFTKTYKKVSADILDELFKKIDWDYMLSLPYPAEVRDQKYIGDTELPGGAVIVYH